MKSFVGNSLVFPKLIKTYHERKTNNKANKYLSLPETFGNSVCFGHLKVPVVQKVFPAVHFKGHFQ